MIEETDVVCFLVFIYRNVKMKEVKTPSEDVLGKPAVVEVDIDPVQGTGRVLVNGESWKATAAKALPKNTPCVVEKLNGVTLFVKEK